MAKVLVPLNVLPLPILFGSPKALLKNIKSCVLFVVVVILVHALLR